MAENSTLPSLAQTIGYVTNDHLGSPRINTDQNGAVTARHDYQPFGEEITRASYGADDIREQFATYERDKEISLDFAQARYHNFNLGRFQTPDPLYFTAARLIDPQQFNLYVYVRNNPLRYIDPDGEDYVGTDGEKVNVEYLRNKKGKIIGIAKVGENATEELKKIVGLIQKYGSQEALNDFVRGDQTVTRIILKLEGGSSMSPKTSAGVPEYTKDPKTGKWVYTEVTVNISINNLNLKGFKEQLEKEFGVSDLIQEEYTLASFGHEISHATDTEEVESRREIFLNKTLNEKELIDKLYDNYKKIGEPKGQDRARKILQEINKLKNNP